MEKHTLQEVCKGNFVPDVEFPNISPWWFIDLATPTDFRQSPLRIDLDGDNSSGHIAAGYYDTLTTCIKEAPVVDHDVELYTCGTPGSSGMVDSISFRLMYYDQPQLPEEFIFSEGFQNELQATASPSRWIWKNTDQKDPEQIKDFLRSLRYRADWDPADPEQSRERTLAVTMHVDGDSTSSWTVYQLQQSEVYAGQDTTVEYCTEVASLDLRSYLSTGVDPDAGTFSPEPSGGGSLFVPGTDKDTTYFYIIASNECRDTAVIAMKQAGRDNLGLDAVRLCPGGSQRIGFPPGKFTYVEWWDGSTEDSILVVETTDVQRQVRVGFQGCTISIPVDIIIQSVEGLAGKDTVIAYCADGGPLTLDFPEPPPGGRAWIEPPLSGGGLEYSPGTDVPGQYHYIVTTGEGISGCADTALITLEESAISTLVLDPVTWCDGEEVSIGLPPDTYDEVTWWNGYTGDSTTLSRGQSAPFTVEARLDGCIYTGEVMVTEVPEVVLPKDYADIQTICSGEIRTLNVSDLDSVQWNGEIYYPGEEITLDPAGDYILRGFRDGCVAEKTISVMQIPDPSPGYSQTISRCGSEPATLILPEDSPMWRFRWADGTGSRERSVDSTGTYAFVIESDHCAFHSFYEVVEDVNCITRECTLSIPNAVSPNGDGVNDLLEIFPQHTCGTIESVTLWDKWGTLLYSTTSPVIGSGVWQDLPGGVYVVRAEYRDHSGKLNIQSGSVTVIR